MAGSQPLSNLIIYRGLLKDGLVQKMQALAAGAAGETGFELAAGLVAKAEQLGLAGDLWPAYLIHLIAQDENAFSTTVGKTGGHIGDGLTRALLHDLALLRPFARTVPAHPAAAFIGGFSPTVADAQPAFVALRDAFLGPAGDRELADLLVDYYSRHGCGKAAGFAAFRWDETGGLAGIKHPDDSSFEDIVGYDYQKGVLRQNTEAFLAGRPANNILLVGARGTGKSSCVKALIPQYFGQGLRLVEVSKHQLRHLHQILDALRGRSQKFIVFLDDLSFEENETEYKHLKSAIEGGVEAKPDNVLIYATSNRRHLIRESWQDREGGQDIHSLDSVHEKISLADRFGIILTYPAPDQSEYLKIVEAIAKKHAVDLPADELKKLALRWEMSHSGRSGRVAQQFVKHIMGNN